MKKLLAYFLPIATVFMLMMSTASVSMAQDAAQAITPGFKWTKVRQTYRFIGDNKTWAYCEAPVNAWIWCNDNECESILIAAAESGHWLGVNFTGSAPNSFNHVRLYKN